MNALQIRHAHQSDISFIRELETQAFGFTWDEETFQKELTRENGATIVAKLGDQLVASALLVWAADEVQLNSIVLASEFRGKGLSRWFLGSMMAWRQNTGCSWFTLEVKWHNPPALQLYRNLGFVTTARRAKYYRDGQDARIMWAGHLQSDHHRTELSRYLHSASQLRSKA
jgi:[ribosomal protein S18]-alanine N-acetyltransferase